MDALPFLAAATPIGPLLVVHGDEGFLKRRVIAALKTRVAGDDGDEQAFSVHAGETATFAAVFDELETVPFFASRRLVLIENADPFVTQYRTQLEKKIGGLPKSSVLVLDVKTWASNTRLAKLVDANAAIACKAPPAYKVSPWCVEWAKAQQGKQLTSQAAALLVDLVGGDMGLLDQEILKLAIYVGKRARIDVEDVDKLVGQNRGESTWKIFDALAEGNAATALAILDRLFEQAEEPLRIAGAFAYQLRRLAQAARLAVRGVSIASALQQAGIQPFGLKSAEQQLRFLGRRRALRLYDSLLELNMGLRGASTLSERHLMERFLVKLAQPQTTTVRG